MKIVLSEGAIAPTRAHSGDLGYDLYSNEFVTLGTGEYRLVSTGVQIAFPDGYGGIIKDRSSVSSKNGVFVHAGVVDNGYRGDIKVLLYNASSKFYHIGAGDKIAQLIPIPVTNWDILTVSSFDDSTSRGDLGFGSSGK